MKILRDGLGIVCAFCLMIVFLITLSLIHISEPTRP